jgi:hypothetical protein
MMKKNLYTEQVIYGCQMFIAIHVSPHYLTEADNSMLSL